MSSIRRTGKRREIAERVREKRLAAGLTQEGVAKQLGLQRIQMINIEAGRQSIPAERLLDFARVLATTPVELLGAAA